MKRPIMALTAFYALLASGGALAQEPAPTDAVAPAPASEAGASAAAGTDRKFVLGLRLGYGLPMGDAVKSQPGASGAMTDAISHMIPIWLDVGYMVTPNVMLGAYGQYAFVSLKDSVCQGASSCSANDIRFGVQAQYQIMPGQPMNPWIGLGVGYEMLSLSASGDSIIGHVDATEKFKGLEFANLQAGLDFLAAPGIGVGPFVSLSFGEYSSISETLNGQSQSSSSFDKAFHEWLTLGVRGAFNL